jgi:hypothetical protein
MYVVLSMHIGLDILIVEYLQVVICLTFFMEKSMEEQVVGSSCTLNYISRVHNNHSL